jgi:cell division septation protein DedD
MKVLQWILYFVLLGAFVWFVFFRDSNLFALSQKDEPITGEETVSNQSETEGDLDAVYEEEEYAEPEQEEFLEPELNETTVEENETIVEEALTSDPLENSTNTKSSSIIDLNKKYLIIVGSFGQKSNAEKMLRRVKNSGKQGLIKQINGLHRVITASTDSQSDAKDLRAHFTHMYKEQAFILEQ